MSHWGVLARQGFGRLEAKSSNLGTTIHPSSVVHKRTTSPNHFAHSGFRSFKYLFSSLFLLPKIPFA